MARLLLLVALRARLALRHFTGSKGRLIGLVVTLAFAIPLSGLLTLTITAYHLSLPPARAEALYGLVLLAGSLLLVTAPLMGFKANEFLDISKLFHLPARPGVVFSAAVIGSWFNGINLFFVPLLLAPAVASAPTAAEAAARAAMVLLYLFHLFSITQCLTLALLNVLRSRAFRDLVAILAPLTGLALYLGLRLLMPAAGREADVEGMLDALPAERLRPFLPPLWAGAAVLGAGLPRLLWTAALAALTVPLVVLGVALTRKAFYGEIALPTGPRSVREEAGLLRRIVLRLAPPETGAMYEKELLTLRREPWFKTLFIQQLGFVVLVVVLQMAAPVGAREGADPRFILAMAALLLLFIETSFVSNVLALEGPGILHLMTLPARRLRVLLGKNLAHFQALLLINAALLPLLAVALAIFGPPGPFPLQEVLLLLAVNLAALPVVLGAGMVSSVWFPAAMAPRGKRALSQGSTGGEGCLNALYRSMVGAAMLVPVGCIGALIYGVPMVVQVPLVHLATVPMGVLAGLSLYALLLRLAASGLERREASVLEELLKGGR